MDLLAFEGPAGWPSAPGTIVVRRRSRCDTVSDIGHLGMEVAARRHA